MYSDLITVYCVRYDPYVCEVDPELLWESVQAAGGWVSSRPAGCFDFYVPERIISFVLLRDSALKIVENRSYI